MIDIKKENIIIFDEGSTSSVISLFNIFDEAGKNIFYISNDDGSKILSLKKSNKIYIEDVSYNDDLDKIKENLFRVDYIVYNNRISANPGMNKSLEVDILFTIKMLRKITDVPIFIICSKAYVNKHTMKDICNKKNYNLYEFTYDKSLVKNQTMSYPSMKNLNIQFDMTDFKDCYFIEDLLKNDKASFESLKEKYIRGLKIKDILSDDDL